MAQRVFPLPTRRSIGQLKKRLADLDAHRARLKEEGEAMIAGFRECYPDAPAYLTRYRDRTLSDYRWRTSSAKRWRGKNRPGYNYPFELIGERGQELLKRLPGSTRKHWLEYENQRLSLNHESAMVNYERLRIQDQITKFEKLRQLLRAG